MKGKGHNCFEEEHKVDMKSELPIFSNLYEALVEATEKDSTTKTSKSRSYVGGQKRREKLVEIVKHSGTTVMSWSRSKVLSSRAGEK